MARRVWPSARPHDSNERCGGLWSASPRLHLWSLLTVRNHALLGFFLDHYARHGVLLQTNAHVVLHEDFAPTTALTAAQRVLRLRGVSHDVIPSVDARLLEPIKIAKLNRAIQKLSEDALVIFADGNTLRLTTSTVSARIQCDALSQVTNSSPFRATPWIGWTGQHGARKVAASPLAASCRTAWPRTMRAPAFHP